MNVLFVYLLGHVQYCNSSNEASPEVLGKMRKKRKKKWKKMSELLEGKKFDMKSKFHKNIIFLLIFSYFNVDDTEETFSSEVVCKKTCRLHK